VNQDQIKAFILKMTHDLACHKRCLDLVSVLLSEGEGHDDAKKLLSETIEQVELTQKYISFVHGQDFRETQPEKGIS
jgi:hypothetical protein